MGILPLGGPQSNPPLGIFSRKNSLIFALIMVILVIAGIFVYNINHKTITITVDGETREVSTFVGKVGDLLAEEGIVYASHDQLSVDPVDSLRENMNITLIRAMPVHITADGKTEKVFTHQETVEQLLAETGIELNLLDKVQPGLQANVQSESEIVITRVTEEIVEVIEKIKYGTVRKADTSMKRGDEKTVQTGQEGEAKHSFIVTYENGIEVKREPIGTEMLKTKLDSVIAYGTIEMVSRGGFEFVPRKTLDNVVLTAYSAGVEHTGKKPGDKGYGMTRSGTTVTDGRTIAVDPKVIPLGWWVWIEGYGLRKAEDTGGAVKGNKIDIYFSDNETAHDFGLKKGNTVHIIGPNKPGN